VWSFDAGRLQQAGVNLLAGNSAMTHLVIWLAQVFLVCLIGGTMSALAAFATLYTYKKLGGHSESEEPFFLNLLLIVIGAPAVVLAMILCDLINLWLGWE
jgi:hypothetical protein